MTKEIKPGIYEHYKGNHYRVIGLSRHSETLEELVVYKALYDSPEFGSDSIWVRPKTMFLEKVAHKGQQVPRFKLIEPAS